MHGGKSLRGIASPTYKGKGYSKDLPPRLASMFDELLQDDDWLSAREDIALLRTRMRELMQRLESGEGGSLFDRLAESLEEYKAARDSDDLGRAVMAADRLVEAIESGASYEATWRELVGTVEGVSKVRDRESKRLIAQEQMMTADQAMILIAALTSAVHAEVLDTETRDKIGRRFQAILNKGEPKPQILDAASLPAPIEDAGIEEGSEDSPALDEESDGA